MRTSIETLRARALVLALGTVGLTALAALVFPGEASRLAPLALALPFVTMGMLEGLVDSERRSAR
jgi:glucose-6-phosphate-specific signal transduction histidine kinase